MTVRRRTLLIVALVALVTPLVGVTQAANAQDQSNQCARGVLIEGRCLSIDGVATQCLGDDCIEFVEEVRLECPAGFVPIAGAERCERVVRGEQSADGCPDGARGVPDDCHLLVAKGPNGCPADTTDTPNGDCKWPLQNAAGGYYCVLDGQELIGRDCRSVAERVPSDCPTDTVRFDMACWRVGALIAPESCSGHGEASLEDLPSGRCRVRDTVFEGSVGCAVGADFFEGVPWLLWEPGSETIVAQGPFVTGCSDGTEVAPRLDGCPGFEGSFLDDNGIRRCHTVVPAEIATCGADYSQDDFSRGQCARFASVTSFDPPECPVGWELDDDLCVEVVPFEAFACPSGTEPISDQWGCHTIGPEYRVEFDCEWVGLTFGGACLAFTGPQPGICNGIGTIDDCSRIDEPAAATCAAATGCVRLGDFTMLGDVDCDAEVTIIDALLIAQYSALAREGTGACVDRVPATQLYLGDGDVNGDELVDIIDALLVAQCDAGLPVLEDCG